MVQRRLRTVSLYNLREEMNEIQLNISKNFFTHTTCEQSDENVNNMNAINNQLHVKHK